MANKIGIVLALDGEKEFTAAVQTAKKEVNMLQSELSGLSEEFDGQANSMEALTKKQKVLTQQQEAYQRKLDAAKSGQEKANKNYQDMGKRLTELKGDLENARKELQKMDEGTEEYKKQAKAVEELEKAVEKQTIAHTREAGSIAEWNQRVRESQRELDKSNSEIEKNAKYLDEARNSADHCATSIDKMGREVKEAGDDIDEAGKKSSTFGDVLKANLTADAVTAGVRKIGEAAKEAAEYVVDVGSSFEAAMSEVQAISGAAGSDLDAMSEKAQELGASTKFTATEVANAFKYMSLAGWKTSDMLSGIDGVLSLAAASGMELAQASDMVTDYLSAFGMEASESIKIADMLAFAQANSNTTAEQLGEAYGNCAANMHAAGQDIETTTSFLEAFANQGIKGSEAGTKMSAIMRDITAKMKDGKIAIGDTNVEVTDANGNFRDLTDIMTDVEAATQGMGDAERAAALSATFTSRSVGGLNMILTEGMENVSGYETALRNAGGAADEAATIMQDNLSGDLTTMNSALEGLGIAAYDYVKGPLRGVVQGVTDIIGGITDVIAPQKTELEKFIEDIKTSNDEVNTLLENAQTTISGAETDVGNLEAYKTTLLELNSETEKTEFQKFQMKSIVTELADTIPELSAAFDEEASSISLTNEEIAGLIDNQKNLVMQQALLDAQKDAMEAVAKATINKAKADSAVNSVLEEGGDGLKSYIELMESGATVTDEQSIKYGQLAKDLDVAKKEQVEANQNLKSATEISEENSLALKDLNEQYGLLPQTMEETADGAKDTADAVSETARVFDEYGNDITDMSEEQAAAVTEASAKIVDAYQDMRDGVASSIKDSMSLFDEFSGGTETTAKQINQNLESQIAGIEKWSQNMETLAGQIGQGMSQELYDELAAMGPEQSATAVQALVDALSAEDGQFEEVSKNWSDLLSLQENADAISEATTAGKDYAAAVAAGMNEGEGDITAAGESMVQAAVQPISEGTEEVKQSAEQFGDTYAEAIRSKEKTSGEAGTALGDAAVQGVCEQIDQMKAAGDETAGKYVEALRAHQQEAAQAAGALASAAQNAVMSYRNAFETAGYYISAAVASGISYGASDAINAARNMAARTLAAAKAELDIHSPSKKFRKQVGQNISESTAFGISDKASLAGNEAAKMSAQVYSKATAWLSKYKKSHKVSLDDEQYYWQQVLQHVKNGTAAYNNAIKKLATKTFSGTGLSGSAATSAMKKIESNFGVSRTKTTGSGKNQKTVKKDAESYYSEIYNAANKYISNMQTLNDWSLQAELSYWTAVQAQLKKGTQAWYDAAGQIRDLQADIAEAEQEAAEAAEEAEEERIRTLQSVHGKILSQYKTYFQVSAKAEMEYWDIARQQFTEGTDARIEADQAYFDAREEYYDQLAELDEDYAEKKKDIDDELADSIKDLQKTYDDAVKSREQEIRSSMGLFDAWDAEGWDSGKLMENLKTQVEGLQFWEQQLDELAGKGVTQELMDELAAMGPDAAANLWSLNQMTAEQLDEYQRLWEDKNNLAHKQALEDNKNLLKETQDSIADATKAADEELAKLKKDYDDAVAKLNTGLSDGLKSLVTQAKDVGEEIVSSLVDAVRKGMTDVTALVTQAKQQAASQSTATAAQATPATQAAQATQAAAAASAKTSSSSSAKKTTEKDKLLAIIKTGTKRDKKLSDKDKAAHSTLWQRIVKNYGYSVGESQMKQIADLLGVKASKNITTAEKEKVRAAMAAKGYAAGARNIWQDELAWMLENAKTEYVVRTADKAILQPMRAGDKVINPKGAENLYDFAADPTKFISARTRDALAAAQEAMQKRQDEMRSQIPELSYGGITRLNRLMESGMRAAPVVNVDNRELVSMMQQMVSGMQAIMGQVQELQERQIVMDSGALVGTLQQPMSRANAAAQRRRNRGTPR